VASKVATRRFHDAGVPAAVRPDERDRSKGGVAEDCAQRPGPIRLRCSLERCAGRPRLRDDGISQTKIVRRTRNVCFCWLRVVDRNVQSRLELICREHHHVPQRFPTVRRVTQLGNCEQNAKMRGKYRLRIHRLFKERAIAGLSRRAPVEIWCITAGKGVRLQWEWCALRRAHWKPGRRRRPPGRKFGWGDASPHPVRRRRPDR